jgi:hypothetical protein
MHLQCIELLPASGTCNAQCKAIGYAMVCVIYVCAPAFAQQQQVHQISIIYLSSICNINCGKSTHEKHTSPICSKASLDGLLQHAAQIAQEQEQLRQVQSASMKAVLLKSSSNGLNAAMVLVRFTSAYMFMKTPVGTTSARVAAASR